MPEATVPHIYESVSDGDLYDPFIHTSADGVYDIYEALRRDHPIYFCEVRQTWCLTRYSDIQKAGRSWQGFSNRPGTALDAPNLYGPGDFLDDDPPYHDVLRALVRPFFTPKKIATLADDITRRTDEILAELREQPRANLAAEFAVRLPIWVIARLLGAPEGNDYELQKNVLEIETRNLGDPTVPPSATAALAWLQGYVAELAAYKRSHPDDTVLSHIANGDFDVVLTPEEVAGMAGILFTAGSETTYALLGNILGHLADNPQAQEDLRRAEGTDLIDAAVEESLRFEAPVQYSSRTVQETTEFHGTEVPAGSRIILIWASGHRDPERWDRPDEYDIHRVAQRHHAFGEGIHFCLGAPLARLEARIAIPAFLRTFAEYDIRETRRRRNHIVRGWDLLDADLVAAP